MTIEEIKNALNVTRQFNVTHEEWAQILGTIAQHNAELKEMEIPSEEYHAELIIQPEYRACNGWSIYGAKGVVNIRFITLQEQSVRGQILDIEEGVLDDYTTAEANSMLASLYSTLNKLTA